MNKAYLEIKNEHKQLAQKIRELKNERKTAKDGYVPSLERHRSEYRHRHIAFCELLGKTREQIERPNSKVANEYYIDKIKQDYKVRLDEASKKDVEVVAETS